MHAHLTVNIDKTGIHASVSRLDAPRIIGLCGGMRSGKDTAAAALSHFGYERLAIADAMKEMVATHMRAQGVDEYSIHGALYGDERHIPQPSLGGQDARTALELLGDWGRRLHTDFWLRPVLHLINGYPERRFVVADIRDDYEAEVIRDLGGFVYGVVRPDRQATSTHRTETAATRVRADATLHNISPTAEEFARYVSEEFCAQFAS